MPNFRGGPGGPSPWTAALYWAAVAAIWVAIFFVGLVFVFSPRLARHLQALRYP